VSPIQRLDVVALFGTPCLWIALVGIIALIGGFLTWGVVAWPPVITSVLGVISTWGGPLEIGASLDGTVTSLFVSVGTAVEPSNTLAIIVNDEGKSVRIRTPIAGQVVEIATQDGDFVRSGESLGTIQRLDQQFAAFVLVPASAAGGVAGYEQFTVPKQPIIQVLIDLDRNQANPSGFAWTIGSGPPFTIPMGSPWEGQIITGDRSPLATLFGSR
jgi:multidrug efflux pump subunit AcrA (membrane-fusion protein)